MSIVITGGGTGGHLSIAKVVALELKSRGYELIYIGSTKGQDREWFDGSEIFKKSYFLDSSGVVNKRNLNKLTSLLNIINLSKECRKIYKDQGVKAVFSVGGYSASPACFGTLFSNIPLFIHEQNAFIGRLNRLFKPFSKCFYSSYFEPKFDYPVDNKFFKTAREREEIKKVLFLGGSQGAKFINSLAMDLALNLTEQGIEISHQCGKAQFEEISKFYESIGVKVDLFSFSKELELKMQSADLCISRSGASSLWELCANQLPAIFIPFPYASNDHQFYNAKFLVDSGLAKIYRQEDAKKSAILDEISRYDVGNISKKLASTLKPDAVTKIVDDMISKM